MFYDITHPEKNFLTGFFPTHDCICVSNTTNIFHGTIFIVRAKNMINFWEWISLAEVFLVESNSCFCDIKCHFVSDVLLKWLPAKDALWNSHWIIILKYSVRACAESIQICGNFWSLLKIVNRNLIILFVKVKEPFNSMSFQNVFAFLIVRVLVKLLNSIWYGNPFILACHY